MKTRIQNLTLGVLVGWYALCGANALALVIVVDNTGAGDYSTVQDAWNGLPATFTEDVTIKIVNNGVDYDGMTNSAAKNGNGFSLTIQSVAGTSSGPARIVHYSTGGIIEHGLDLSGWSSTGGRLTVSNLRFQGGQTWDTGGASAAIAGLGANMLISQNIFEKASGPAAARVRGTLVRDYQNQAGLVIERNFLDGLSEQYLIADRGASYGGIPTNPMIVRNNIVQGTGLMFIGGSSWGTGGSGAAYFVNNTVDLVSGIPVVSMHNTHSGTDLSSFIFVNNLLTGEGESGGSVTGARLGSGVKLRNGVFDNNLYYLLDVTGVNGGTNFVTLASWQAELALAGGPLSRDDLNSVTGDPMLAAIDNDADPWDLEIRIGSAAHNTGLALSTVLFSNSVKTITLADVVGTTDFFGNTRVVDVIDIGAYEVPEPGVAWLLGIGGIGLWQRMRRLCPKTL